MTNDELFDILRPIVLSVTGVPECILANPNTPSPDGEYASIQPQQSVGERGQANIIRKAGVAADTQDIEIQTQIVCRASINFYRGDARTRASKLKQCNKRPNISADLFAAKLGWQGTGAVNDLTALQSNNWESRAQIEIVLLYTTSDELTINSIESVPLEVYDISALESTPTPWVDSDLWIDSDPWNELTVTSSPLIYSGEINP